MTKRAQRGTAARVQLDGCSGRISVPCTIIGESRTKYVVKLAKGRALPDRFLGYAREDYRVPKHAVHIHKD